MADQNAKVMKMCNLVERKPAIAIYFNSVGVLNKLGPGL